MSMTLVMILAYTVALPAGVGLYFYKSINRSVHPLVYLFCVSVLFELLSTLFRILFHNNLIVLQCFTIAEAWFILTFLSNILINKMSVRFAKLLRYVIIIVAVFEMFINPYSFGSVTATFEGLLIVAGFIAFFFEVAFGSNVEKVIFYVSGILLFYFVTSSIYFLTVELLDKDSMLFVSNIHLWVNALINLSTAFIIWKTSHSNSLLLD
jgi:hypothetical protein